MMNTSLMQSCHKLKGYSILVAKIREYGKSMSRRKAVTKAIDYCISNNILRDFLLRERKAVTMYSLYEYNQAGHMKVLKDEAREEGIKEGLEQGIIIFIDGMREYGCEEEIIRKNLIEKFKLTPENADEYLARK